MALQIEGTAWVFGDDINTDLILPGAAFLLPVEEQIKYCFSANRPGWSDEVQPGDIVVAGTNFGPGSARPIGNVFARLGVAGIIASTFNGLGLRNCVNYGVHVLPCPAPSMPSRMGIELPSIGRPAPFGTLSQESEISGKALPQALLDIAEAGGVIPVLKSEGLLEDAE